jgi:hypothetical protein
MPKSPIEELAVDELDDEALAQLYDETLETIGKLERRWRGLVSLTEKARAKHAGKNLGPLTPALRPLFTAMLPDPHDEPMQAKERAKFAALFDVHGAADGGKDPDRFEAPLLLRRMRRVTMQQDIAVKLDTFSRKLADDTLHTSETVFVAGQYALDTARSIGEDNPKYGSFLTAVFDALRNMTKAALARAAELRAERAAAKAAKPKADKPADEPKTP